MSYEVNTGQNPTVTTEQSYTEQAAPKKPKRWPWIVGIVVALVVGTAIGASTNSAETKTVTKTDTQYVTNDVIQTPTACKTALAQADRLLAISAEFATTTGEVIQAASDGFTAVAAGDIAGMQASADAMSGASTKIQGNAAQVEAIGPVYRAARDECEAS